MAAGAREIERKFLLTTPAHVIEKAAVAEGALASMANVAQRYLDTAGWRLRARTVHRTNGVCERTLTLKHRTSDARIAFSIEERCWMGLLDVCDVSHSRKGDAAGTLRLRLDDLSNWTVRLRRTVDIPSNADTHVLTLKRGITMVSCQEIESEVPAHEHDAVIACFGPAILKRRSCIRHDGHVWEVDTYLNPELEGIEVAEIEIAAEDAPFARPRWAGIEVTEDKRYKNARLAKRLTDWRG